MKPATAVDPRGHLSGETLDLLLIGALPPADANAAKGHLDTCEPCRARWRELNEDKRRFEEHVFARTLPKVEAEVARSGGYPLAKRGWPVTAWLALATAVVGVVAVQHWTGARASLEVSWVRPGEAPVSAPAGARIPTGDRLRFLVTPGGARYLLLAERDETGAMAVHFPPAGSSSARLRTSGRLEIGRPRPLTPDGGGRLLRGAGDRRPTRGRAGPAGQLPRRDGHHPLAGQGAMTGPRRGARLRVDLAA